MIDVSDGLVADLGQSARARVSPLASNSSDCRSPPQLGRRRPRSGDPSASAAGGDDYELDFTAPAASSKEIGALSSRLGLTITDIGEIIHGAGVELLGADGEFIPVNDRGYRHF